MKSAICFCTAALFIFSGNNAFAQIANYKHEGYTIHHINNKKHQPQLNRQSLTMRENYKTNGFLHKAYAEDTVKKTSERTNQNCLVMDEHYKVQFKPRESPSRVAPDTAKLVAKDLLMK